MKITISLFFVFIISMTMSAQNYRGMHPIDKGNVWIYDDYEGHYATFYLSDELVSIDSFEYNVLYYQYFNPSRYIRLREDNYFVIRRDSNYNEPNHEEIFYKKNARVGDSWTQLVFSGDTLTYTSVVTDSIPAYVFDTVVVGRIIRTDFGLNVFNQLWTEEFGLLYTEDFYGPMSYLAGCIIKGKLYGDTSTTSEEYEPITLLPETIGLLQNYPNPFNPTTKIRFRIADLGFVYLKVYDVLGNEIAPLINKEMSAGEYEVEFNAATLPGGVYFYSLQTDNNIITKKMVLLR
jgi:hypothetical protein